MTRRFSSDSGNVSIAMLGGTAIVMVLLVGVADLAVFFLARSRAQTAADSAALAAAAELIPAIGIDPKGKANEFASANGATLLSCECAMGTDTATVRVSVPVAMMLPGLSEMTEVTADSRAKINLAAASP